MELPGFASRPHERFAFVGNVAAFWGPSCHRPPPPHALPPGLPVDGRRSLNPADGPAEDISVRRLLAVPLALLALSAASPPGADAAARRCGKVPGAKSITASGTSCTFARRLAREVAGVRHDRDRYAQARRCSGDFCIVVLGWRCKPAPGVAPRERCTSRGRSVSWVWTS